MLEEIHPSYRDSAINLLHYLALRGFELRPLQDQLSSIGISSISHSERYTYTNLSNILYLLYLLKVESMHEVNKRGNELYLGLPRSIIR